jgi:hypothetical protein
VEKKSSVKQQKIRQSLQEIAACEKSARSSLVCVFGGLFANIFPSPGWAHRVTESALIVGYLF